MASEGGVNVSHSAIKRMRDALTEVLEELAPNLSAGDENARTDQIAVFPKSGSVEQLIGDAGLKAVGARSDVQDYSWPAAVQFHSNIIRAHTSISTSYIEIVTMVNMAIARLNLAQQHYASAEEAGSSPAAQV
ncbi:hypothetical protein [Thermostaphylospora chromogena]|uniref:PE family protein n=1 Tax=Thermostaphylospora chromogena TaxID=35622 RepID=A0A1H1ATE2_9ACTN|nr:hypothetical protein [Thermostaphylospora chromogena]SDQ42791.1 hypothetical protein SAMN04489764_0640 [Thermostaphylospora chromogena]